MQKNRTNSGSLQSNIDLFNYAALLIFAIALPWSLAGMQIGLLLVFAAVVAYLISCKEFPFRNHTFFIFLGIYLAIRFGSVLVSPQIKVSLLNVIHTDWVVLMVPFLITIPLSSKKMEKVVHVLLLSASLVGLYGISQFFIGFEFIRGKELGLWGNFYRAIGGYNFYLTFGGNQLMFFGLALSFFLTAKKWNLRKSLYLLIAVILFASFMATFGRSIWLGAIVAISIGTLTVKRKWFGYSVALLAIIVIFAIIVSPSFQTRISSIFDPSQNEGRLNLWHTSLRMIVANPLWGIGPGLFDQVFEIYKVPGFYDAFGHSHNDFLNMAVNSGILGLLAWLGVWGSWFYFVLKAFRQNQLFKFESRLMLGCILSISGILVAALFQCYFTDLENNIAWWFIAALGLHAAIQENKQVNVTES